MTLDLSDRAGILATCAEYVSRGKVKFHNRCRFNLVPLAVKEVEACYREDAFIWRFFQAARQPDRFVIERILRRRYPLHLPGKIER